MQPVTLIFFAAVVAVALAEGQYYVPRAYYTIDAEGHVSPPVPLRRLRRSLSPYPYGYPGAGAVANANAQANAQGGDGGNTNAIANANARAVGSGGWDVPSNGAINVALGAGQFRRQSGAVLGARSVSAGSSVGVDSSGAGYYDQYVSVRN